MELKTCKEMDCACFECQEIAVCQKTNYIYPCRGRIIEPDCKGYPVCTRLQAE